MTHHHNDRPQSSRGTKKRTEPLRHSLAADKGREEVFEESKDVGTYTCLHIYIYIYIYIYWAGRHYIGPIVPMFPALVYWMHLDLIYTMPLYALLRDVPCCLLFLLN